MPDAMIPADVAAELFDSDDSERSSNGEWVRMADQITDTGGRTERRWLVVSRGDGVFGIRYEDGLYPWDDDTVEELRLTPLVGVPVTTTKYLTERQYKALLAKGGSDG